MLNSQWTFPRYQSTSVFPTTSSSWWNTQPFCGNAKPQRRAAKHLGHMVYRETFFFFFANPVAFSTVPYPQELHQWNSSSEEPLHSSTVEKSERQARSRSEMPVWTVSQDSVVFSGGDYSKNYGADQQRLQISDLHFDKFPTPATFACWKIRFMTEVCTCSQFPTESMLVIKEVVMVESVDVLKSS